MSKIETPEGKRLVSIKSRRRVLQAAISGVVGVSLSGIGRPALAQTAPASAAAGAVRTSNLADNLHLLTVGETNIVARTDSNGVVLVDGATADMADPLLDAVAALPNSGPMHTLINTHWHPEHTGLNAQLGTAGTAIIAQENTRLWLSTDITYPWDGQHFEPLPANAQPNQTFYDDGELSADVRYGYLRHAAHTDGDLYVYFPLENVLAVGDAASGAAWPLVDWWTGGWIGGIVGTMELLLALSDAETKIVPARGRILDRNDIESQHQMYNIVYERLAEMLNRGRGPDEAVAARPTQEFDPQMGPSDVFVRRAFESLWAYLSPDA